MPICQNCKIKFPSRKKVGEKYLYLHTRKYCLECNPFGSRSFWGGHKVVDDNGESHRHKEKKFTCSECGKKHVNSQRSKICYACKTKKQRHKNRLIIYGILGNKCIVCGYKRPEVFDIHHKKDEIKNFNFSAHWDCSLDMLKKESKKCVLLCRNCHAELHAGLFCLLV